MRKRTFLTIFTSGAILLGASLDPTWALARNELLVAFDCGSRLANGSVPVLSALFVNRKENLGTSVFFETPHGASRYRLEISAAGQLQLLESGKPIFEFGQVLVPGPLNCETLSAAGIPVDLVGNGVELAFKTQQSVPFPAIGGKGHPLLRRNRTDTYRFEGQGQTLEISAYSKETYADSKWQKTWSTIKDAKSIVVTHGSCPVDQDLLR